jgi:HptB-dependent secretion and biofilm anti anti-sigma factor
VITTQIQGAVGLVKVDGRFTFQEYDAFKAVTKGILEGHWITEIGVDLSGATYMDSNALSMLIALKEKAQAKSITIKLVKPSPSIQTILEMVQFEKLFQIVV